MKACKHLWLYNLGCLGLVYQPFTSNPVYIVGRQCTRCGAREGT